MDGCRLAARGGATVHTYRHRDCVHLAELLQASPAARKVVVTDNLFSMDGHWAPLTELSRVSRMHGALLMVDDAHATLVGAPLDEHASPEADLVVGTLSKAVGSLGGFVACSRTLKLLLLSRARGQIYSTALPLPCVAAAHAALNVAAEEPGRRAALWARVAQLQALTGLRCHSPIVSLHVGDEQRALEWAAALLREGFHVPAIRPPTVPSVRLSPCAAHAPPQLTPATQGTARLRIALSAAHSERDVAELAAALRKVGAIHGVQPPPQLYSKL